MVCIWQLIKGMKVNPIFFAIFPVEKIVAETIMSYEPKDKEVKQSLRFKRQKFTHYSFQ